MLFFIIIFGALFGLALWHYKVENVARFDVKINPSQNISYNNTQATALTTNDIAHEFEKYDGKPILLYIYTTWCPSCKKNFANFNEIAREFQATDLHIIAIAIDRDLSETALHNALNQYGQYYFSPHFLAFKEGFKEFLQQKGINYDGRIPFTALINREDKVVVRYSGVKSKNYLRNKVIETLYF